MSTTTTSTTKNSITSLADEVTAEIFSFVGATDTARCAPTCRNWNRVAQHSRALWRRFVYDDYGLAEGSEAADWKSVYAYIKRQEQRYWQLQANVNEEDDSHNNNDGFIPSRLVFCDDGSHQPGNNPQHALTRDPEVCWCTNAFVDRDVDLVADLAEPNLIMAFEIANGGLRFSAPVKEALAFASFSTPDLESARKYDGDIPLAHAMVAENENINGRKLPPGHPLAGFVFPGIPAAYDAVCQQAVRRPTVARYVHYKLLTSSKCHNRVSNNIDVCSLFAFGIPLADLSQMIHPQTDATNAANVLPPDPSQFVRRHKVRDYPWHIHDAFREEEHEVAILDYMIRMRRMGQHEVRREDLFRHLQGRADAAANGGMEGDGDDVDEGDDDSEASW